MSEELNQEIVEKEEKQVIEIAYYRPKFWKRMSAAFFDAVVFALISLVFIVAIQQITHSTPNYKEKNDLLNSYYAGSSLYVYDSSSKSYESIVDFYQSSTNYDWASKVINYRNAIENFFTFMKENTSEENYEALLLNYNESRLSETLTYNGSPLFIRNENGEIVRNSAAAIPSQIYVEEFYEPYITGYLRGILVVYIPEVLELEQYLTYLTIFLEIPLAVTLGYILIYLVIPLCLSRGKKTLGRLIFHLGLVDKNVLSVSRKLYLVRWLIMFFAELVLSVFTFCIPILISVTMMVFSKKKQNFHDYMLGIEEVDDEYTKILKRKSEAVETPKSKYDIDSLKLK